MLCDDNVQSAKMGFMFKSTNSTYKSFETSPDENQVLDLVHVMYFVYRHDRNEQSTSWLRISEFILGQSGMGSV